MNYPSKRITRQIKETGQFDHEELLERIEIVVVSKFADVHFVDGVLINLPVRTTTKMLENI
ncbi:hypothetical protein MICAF_4510002 [Microcystis aeruginosa PCC 9807]|uniref:Uncharacterized protein n=1 Tax=Microcystis aeruginosa PCC 9807 TaxID=1160283 RepID=I4HA90_MICAE|nr:hypothetical protein MICAF_4510002 [Microcystis aeruginosa PCC 9807]